MDVKTGKKLLFCMGLAIVGFTLIISGSSYALLNSTNMQNRTIANNLQIQYDEGNESAGDIVYLTVPYPISDMDAMQRKPYVFSVTNQTSTVKDYTISIIDDTAMASLENCDDCLLRDNYVKFSINQSSPKSLSDIEDGLLLKDQLGPNQTKTYELILWLDEYSDNSVFDKHFFKRLSVQ